MAAVFWLLAALPAFAAIDLSDAERQWIKDHPKISIGVVADNEPYSFFRNGHTLGWTLDVLHRIELETGLAFEPRMGAWTEIYGTFRAGGLDTIADISLTEARQDFIDFTDAYHQRRTMVFHNLDYPLPDPIAPADLASKRIGVIRDIYYLDDLRTAGIEPAQYDSYRDLMAALAFGWVDAVVAPELTGKFFARENGFTNVAAAGPLALVGATLEDFRLGVLRVDGDRNRQMLAGILAKAVAALPADELRAITERWLSYRSSRALSLGPLRLLPEEQAFIANAQPLRVGFMSDYEPFSFLADGNGRGLAVELAHEISASTGLAMDPVFDNWSRLLEAFRNGEIDVITNISRTPEREEFTLFSREYHRIPNAVYVRSGFGPYQGLASLADVAVGIGRDIYYADALAEHVPDLHQFDTQEDIMAALADGTIDVAIMSLANGNAIIRRLGLINIEIGGEFQMEGVEREDLRFGVSPHFPYARTIIDRAMSAMPSSRWRELETRWLGPTLAGFTRHRPSLTSEERDYLDEKGVVNVCVDPGAPPYTVLDKDGNFTGVAAEVMDDMAERGNFAWQVKPVRIWSRGVEHALEHDCDVLPFVTDRISHEEWAFSLPYLTLPMAIAGGLDQPYVDSLADLSGKRVGVAPGESPVRDLAQRYPKVILVEVDSEHEALRSVRSGELDAALGTLPSLGYLLASSGADDVMIAGRIAEDWRAAFATRTDDPILGEIFAKLISALDEEEVQGILNRQMLVRIDRRVDYTRLIQLGAVALVVLALVIYWNRKLRLLNKALEAANARLREVSITDPLTGLYNRRHFDARIMEDFRLCQRNGWPLSVAMIDVDHFKRVNDEKGHVFGDQCLQHIANLARQVFQREGDILARYGGEEFVVFTMGVEGAAFADHLARLRRAVETTAITSDDDEWHLTVSIGAYTGIPADGDEPSDFVRHADAHLYAAKQGGRNCVVTGPLPDGGPTAGSHTVDTSA
ncbi:MAG: hypothetical protein AcusKO_36250 [Acuticoccus sp.]